MRRDVDVRHGWFMSALFNLLETSVFESPSNFNILAAFEEQSEHSVSLRGLQLKNGQVTHACSVIMTPNDIRSPRIQHGICLHTVSSTVVSGRSLKSMA